MVRFLLSVLRARGNGGLWQMDTSVCRAVVDGVWVIDVCQVARDVQRMGVIVCAVTFIFFTLGVRWGINGR